MTTPLQLLPTDTASTRKALPTQAASIPTLLQRDNASIEGLYIHLPFCFHKCHYCDFYSVVDPKDDHSEHDRHARFVARLTDELEHRSRQVRLRPRTIFVGGGTPTLLAPDLWRDFLTTLHRTVDMSRVQEFTVEANPETVTDRLMQVLAAGGVNRISVGAQSFDTRLLKTLERWHEPTKVTAAVQAARSVGIRSVNLDLIFAIPGQTLAQLETDLESALAIGPDHLSCYGLTYEPNTALTRRLQMGQIKPLDEAIEQQMYRLVLDRLETAGFEHYEISNWSRPGHRCQHNLTYWHNQNWLGIGPSAASHVQGHRWKNKPHLGWYLSNSNTPGPVKKHSPASPATDPPPRGEIGQRLPVFEFDGLAIGSSSPLNRTGTHPHRLEPPTVDHEHLPPQRRIGEHLMLMLRLREGVPRPWLEKNLLRDDPRHTTITDLTEWGMLEWCNDHLRLTRRGLFVADTVIGKLL